MRKAIVLLFALGASLALVAAGSPAGAEHAPEGTISVAVVDTCSSEDPAEPDGLCTWTASEPSGWIGVGPWTLTYQAPGDDGELGTADDPEPVDEPCPAGQLCQSQGETDPIPTGSEVSTDTTAGGFLAAGDPEEGEE